MLQSPQPPLSFTSRLLCCISCEEQFSVAEAFVEANHAPQEKQPGYVQEHTRNLWGRMQQQSWRQPLANGPGRPAVPRYTIANHMHADVFNALPLFDAAVFCPRCYTDNRNWLQLQTRPDPLKSIIGISPSQFPMAIVGLLLVIFVAINSLWVIHLNNWQLLVLPLTIIVTGYATTKLVTDVVWKQRMYRYKRPFLPTDHFWYKISPTLRIGLPILLVTLIAIPLTLFILLPHSLDLTKVVLDQLQSDVVPTSSTTAGITMDTLGISRRFLLVWCVFMGMTWLISYLMSIVSVEMFLASVESILPAPLFTSVARMTPVAIREAEKALRLSSLQAQAIHWTKVEQLPGTGIKLTGVHRTPVPTDQPRPEKVAAQQYTIEADRLCRIIKSEISDVTVPPAIPHPNETADLFPHSRTDTNEYDDFFKKQWGKRQAQKT